MSSLRRITKEVQIAKNDPNPYVRVIQPDEEDVYNILLEVKGPENTPYEGGTWIVKLEIPKDYPFKAPKITLLT